MNGLSETVRRNLHLTFEDIAEHTGEGAIEEFGSITAVSASVPTPIFNRVFVYEPFKESNFQEAIDDVRLI